jgi:hypothetical protein
MIVFTGDTVETDPCTIESASSNDVIELGKTAIIVDDSIKDSDDIVAEAKAEKEDSELVAAALENNVEKDKISMEDAVATDILPDKSSVLEEKTIPGEDDDDTSIVATGTLGDKLAVFEEKTLSVENDNENAIVATDTLDDKLAVLEEKTLSVENDNDKAIVATDTLEDKLVVVEEDRLSTERLIVRVIILADRFSVTDVAVVDEVDIGWSKVVLGLT